MIDSRDKKEFTWEELKNLVRSWITEKDREIYNGDVVDEDHDNHFSLGGIGGIRSRFSLVHPEALTGE